MISGQGFQNCVRNVNWTIRGEAKQLLSLQPLFILEVKVEKSLQKLSLFLENLIRCIKCTENFTFSYNSKFVGHKIRKASA